MTTAAEYHAIVDRARQDYSLATYIDNTQRMIQEQSDATRRIRNAWITAAPPLPDMNVEHASDGTGWRPVK